MFALISSKVRHDLTNFPMRSPLVEITKTSTRFTYTVLEGRHTEELSRFAFFSILDRRKDDNFKKFPSFATN